MLSPLKMLYELSTDPAVENAQHEPHIPWFRTGDTFPRAAQSRSFDWCLRCLGLRIST